MGILKRYVDSETSNKHPGFLTVVNIVRWFILLSEPNIWDKQNLESVIPHLFYRLNNKALPHPLKIPPLPHPFSIKVQY